MSSHAGDSALGYAEASPFPHIVLDGLFSAEALREVTAELGSAAVDDGADVYGSNGKRAISDPDRLPPATRSLVAEMNGPQFLDWLRAVTGIADIEPDHSLRGGGVHQSRRGAFLKVHADFNWHPELRLYRRVNVLLYLNEGWQPEWGGELELWRRDMSECAVRVSPVFNRMVIFSTSQTSFHGHPEPLRCPENVRRNSIALYYYSPDGMGEPRRELTDYRRRPGERRFGWKHDLHQARLKAASWL